MASILCIDDEHQITSILKKILTHHGHNVYTCDSGMGGLLMAGQKHLDLIILDIRLNDGNGLNICKALKDNQSTSHIPIIFLSALACAQDRVKGFRKGACDYIPKPFHLEELIARVSIALERNSLGKDKGSITSWSLDSKKKEFSINGEHIHLTQKEFQILSYLLGTSNRVVSKDELKGELWKGLHVGERTIDTHVTNLRKKINSSGIMIKTKFGEGLILHRP